MPDEGNTSNFSSSDNDRHGIMNQVSSSILKKPKSSSAGSEAKEDLNPKPRARVSFKRDTGSPSPNSVNRLVGNTTEASSEEESRVSDPWFHFWILQPSSREDPGLTLLHPFFFPSYHRKQRTRKVQNIQWVRSGLTRRGSPLSPQISAIRTPTTTRRGGTS